VGVAGDVLEQAIREEVAKLASGITDEELDRARAVLEREHLHSIASPSGLADSIGNCTQLLGDPELAYTWPERWADVTAEEVRAAAESLLVDGNMLIVRFDPEPETAAETLQVEAEADAAANAPQG
jgi:predicted Zn-dependent peptidase